jgi:hypothetical protein
MRIVQEVANGTSVVVHCVNYSILWSRIHFLYNSSSSVFVTVHNIYKDVATLRRCTLRKR